MSLSNPRQSTNPATKFIEWKGGDGILSFYDKENKQNIEIELPINFIVLDQLSTIKGYSDEYNGSIISNEVRATRKEDLKVVAYGKDKNGNKKTTVIAEGKYEDIKGTVAQSGGKYSKSVYAVIIDAKNNLDLVNFQFNGSSLMPFINANINDDGSVISLSKNPEVKKKGKTEYYEPEIKKIGKAPEKILLQAVEIDKKLQEYFMSYFDKEPVDRTEVVSEQVNNDLPEINEDDLNVAMPF